MGSTTFTDGVTLTDDDWFNDVNDVAYDILGNGVSVPTTKASARSNLTLSALTEDTTPDFAADFIETYDTSVTGSKKVLLSTLVASQADQETSTSVAKLVSPGRQQYHPSAAKGWVYGDTAGSASASYNLTSITDNGTGDWSINWNIDFSAANYGAVVSSHADSAIVAIVRNGSFAAGVTRILSFTSTTGANTDPNHFACVVYGDQ